MRETFRRVMTVKEVDVADVWASLRDVELLASCSGAIGEVTEKVPDKGPGVTGPGGGRIGAVLVSPLIKPGTVSKTPYNHYALLKSIEDVFGLAHLGYAGQKGLKSFGRDIFNVDGLEHQHP